MQQHNTLLIPAQPTLITLDAALLYASMGWAVYPHRPDGSKASYVTIDTLPPLGNGMQWGYTKDPERIKKYWQLYPRALLSIVTGEVSGNFILDMDVPEKEPGNPNHDGPSHLAALEAKYGPLPETLKERSPSGGEHSFFQHPGFHIANSSGKIGKTSELRSGLDIRGDSPGQVIAAPSKGRYWLNWGTPIAKGPPWLLEEIIRWSGGGPDLPFSGTRKRRVASPGNPEIEALMLQHATGKAEDETIWLKIDLCLKAIDPDKLGYDDWYAIGAAIFNEVGYSTYRGVTGFGLFHKFSARSKRYNWHEHHPGNGGRLTGYQFVLHRWKSYETDESDRPSGFGKLDYIAKQQGRGDWWDRYHELTGRAK